VQEEKIRIFAARTRVISMLGRDTAIIKEGNVAHDGAREVGWRAGGPGEGQGQGDEEDVGS
jgi:hypothetical protein